MWLDPLSDQLRLGLEGVRAELEAGEFELARQSEPALAIFTLPTLIGFVRTPNRRLAEQDAVWLAVLRCYRRRTARLWAPVLLEMRPPRSSARPIVSCFASRRSTRPRSSSSSSRPSWRRRCRFL